MSKCNSCGPNGVDVGSGVDEINTPRGVNIDYVPVPPATTTVSKACCTPAVVITAPAVVSGCRCGQPVCNCRRENILPNAPYITERCGPPCAPTPHYQTVPSCKEDHTKYVAVCQKDMGFKISNAWNVPDCQGLATLTIPGVTNVAIGSFLYQQTFGYFKINSYDAQTGQIVVQNLCTVGNAAVGTAVPACSIFIVTPNAPSNSGGGSVPGSTPYLAVDFTAQAVGVCINITLTTTAGIAVGKDVQINGATYRVSAVISATIITICNDGLGITPNTPVIARNSAGDLQYPVALVDTNPCTNTPVTAGSILVCKDGTVSPLSGVSVGEIPVLIDATTGEVEFRALGVPTATCSTVACCLTLVPGQLSYTFQVADATQFTVGNILQIGSRTDRFLVTAILDDTTITCQIDTNPAVITIIPLGTSICAATCCEVLQAEVDEINTEITAIQAEIAALPTECTPNAQQRLGVLGILANNTSAANLSNGQSANSGIAEVLIQNSSTCKSMAVMFQREHTVEAEVINGSDTEVSQQEYVGQIQILTGAIGSTAPTTPATDITLDRDTGFLSAVSGGFDVDLSFSRAGVVSIAPGQEARIGVRTQITHRTTDSNQLNPSNIYASINYISIAL